MQRRLAIAFWFVVTVACLGSAIYLQSRMIVRYHQSPFIWRSSLDTPAPGYLEAVSIGYEQFASDFFWLRMIQTFASGYSQPDSPEKMFSFFKGITDLDPRYQEVYSFALMGVAEERGNVDLVRQIVSRAVVNIPQRYRVAYEAAFHAFWNMDDPDLALYFISLANLAPDCPDFVDRLAGYIQVKHGRYPAAYEKYMADYLTNLMDKKSESYLRTISYNGLSSAVDSWIVGEIKSRALGWHEQHGAYPTMEQLAQAGAFQGMELPDWNRVRVIAREIAAADEVDLTRDQLVQLIQSTLLAWNQIPPGPFDSSDPLTSGYIIWPNMKPEDGRFVMSRYRAMEALLSHARSLDAYIQQVKESNGGVCPESLEPMLTETPDLRDPFGGEWSIDPVTCQFQTTSVPGILNFQLPDPALFDPAYSAIGQ